MEELRQVWAFIPMIPERIRASLPWDVGQSQWLLWGSIAIYVLAALIAAQAFGWVCGWIAERLVQPKP
jgi:hypothetical protein